MNNSFIRFAKEAEEVMEDFPALKLCRWENSFPYLEGHLNLLDGDRNIIDTYYVRVDCTTNYPGSFPFVYETAGRLPHNIDWHVYSDGHCCICTPLEEDIHCAKGIKLSGFISNHVLPYLFNQKFREENGYFLNERSHGLRGVLEFLVQILRVKNKTEIRRLLNYILVGKEPNRVADCFCGSSKKYRHCHREAFRELRLIDSFKLRRIIEILN